MKKILKIASTVLVFSIIFTSVQTIASPISHKIGFVKIPKNELGQMGNCGYSIVGDKNQNNIVLFMGTSENPLMNVDGETISLKKINRNNQASSKIMKYESSIFKVTTDFRDMTTARDRKEFVVRNRGYLSVTSSDGWKKKINVECAYDGGG
jgi:hypothetical protein